MRFPAPVAVPLIAAGLACAAGQGHAAVLNVAVNHSVRLPVAGRAASVVVGNAAVADVTVVDSHTLFVTGKAAGSTDVAVVDPLGRTVYAADISVGAGSGASVTVHRASATTEAVCDPRCSGAESFKAAAASSLMEDVGGLSPARSAPSGPIAPLAPSPLAAAPVFGGPFAAHPPR